MGNEELEVYLLKLWREIASIGEYAGVRIAVTYSHGSAVQSKSEDELKKMIAKAEAQLRIYKQAYRPRPDLLPGSLPDEDLGADVIELKRARS